MKENVSGSFLPASPLLSRIYLWEKIQFVLFSPSRRCLLLNRKKSHYKFVYYCNYVFALNVSKLVEITNYTQDKERRLSTKLRVCELPRESETLRNFLKVSYEK